MSNAGCLDLDSVKPSNKPGLNLLHEFQTEVIQTRLWLQEHKSLAQWLPHDHHPEEGKAKQAMSTNKHGERWKNIHPIQPQQQLPHTRANRAVQARLFSDLLLNIWLSITLVKNLWLILIAGLRENANISAANTWYNTISFTAWITEYYFIPHSSQKLTHCPEELPLPLFWQVASSSKLQIRGLMTPMQKFMCKRHLFSLTFGWLC